MVPGRGGGAGCTACHSAGWVLSRRATSSRHLQHASTCSCATYNSDVPPSILSVRWPWPQVNQVVGRGQFSSTLCVVVNLDGKEFGNVRDTQRCSTFGCK